jgi:hypothetical protein
MMTATLAERERPGIDQRPDAVAAEAGYWIEQHVGVSVPQRGGAASKAGTRLGSR